LAEVKAMRLLPWDYGVRNLLRRPLRTGLTALGLTLVVFLLLLVVGFLQGLNTCLEQSGDEQVAMIHSITAADNLENSSISDQLPTLVKTELSGIMVNYEDTSAFSPELVIAGIVQAGTDSSQIPLAVFRGVRPEVFLVRRQAYLVDGRFPQSGEILVGRLAAAKLGISPDRLTVGQELIVEGKPWKVSGRFAAPGTLLEAEIWCPLDDLKQHMRRPNDLSLIALRLNPQGNRKQQMEEIEYFCRVRHRDLELMGSPEVDYYASLQKHFRPMQALAWLLVVLVAGAGACGAINTMYAAVAGRVREFAALQAVGFSRRAICVSLLQESVLLAALATLIATGLALLLIQGVAIRFTMGAFALELDRLALLVGIGAGLGLGIIGALPPAVRAFRLPIAAALKAV
jgi:ABC-type antimicrobial peptide transport system permease subunit